jgi:DNA-binding ferritin-like protein
MKTDAEKFVELLMLGRDLAQRAHWAAQGPGSYALHIATADFYDQLAGLTDRFVEQYQGTYGKLMNIGRAVDDTRPIADLLVEQVEWIEMNRYKVCEKAETSLQNLIDEVVGTYQTTIYKLRFLK